jgi:hypothetical protein
LTRRATAFAKRSMVEGKGDKPSFCHRARIDAGRLLFD